MHDYLDSSHSPWLPRHRLFALGEDLPYRVTPLPGHMTPESQADMCAHVANNAIHKMMEHWKSIPRGIGFIQGKKKP